MNEFEKMNEMLTKMTPPEMAGAVNMLAHPVAGAAAMSALGFGLASQALGVWMGGLTGAAEASQRFWQAVPGGFADPSASPLAKARARARALMENAQSAAREAAEAGAVVRPAAAAERPAAVRPEGSRQAEAPDDLKAISGIGPKLEQVLNGLLDGVYYLLIALGLSLIFSLGGIVNLAHGAFYAIGAYLTIVLAPHVGFGFDTALAWAAGKDNFGGIWPCVWHHLIDTPASKAFVAAFTKKYGKPPENQAWGDYMAVKIMAQSMNELKSTDTAKILEHWEKGAKFDVMKSREGYFRASDHQLISEMYTITALPAAQVKNQWDLFTSSPPVPGPNEDLEVIATRGDEAVCKMS